MGEYNYTIPLKKLLHTDDDDDDDDDDDIPN